IDAAGGGAGAGDGVKRRLDVGRQAISVARELHYEGEVEGVEQEEQGEVGRSLPEVQFTARLRLLESLGHQRRDVGEVAAQSVEDVVLVPLSLGAEALQRGPERQRGCRIVFRQQAVE